MSGRINNSLVVRSVHTRRLIVGCSHDAMPFAMQQGTKCYVVQHVYRQKCSTEMLNSDWTAYLLDAGSVYNTCQVIQLPHKLGTLVDHVLTHTTVTTS